MRINVSKVKILSTPCGEAPEWVRQAWIGLELPLSGFQPAPVAGAFEGVISRQPVMEGYEGYAVDGRIAVDLLRVKDLAAALWWEKHAPYVLENNVRLIFEKEVCQAL